LRQDLDLGGGRGGGRGAAGGDLAYRARLGRVGVHPHHGGDHGDRCAAVRVAVPERDALDPGPGVVADDRQRLLLAVHAEGDDLGGRPAGPGGADVPGLDLLGVPTAHHHGADPAVDRPAAPGPAPMTTPQQAAPVRDGPDPAGAQPAPARRGPVDPRLWRHSPAARRYLAATVLAGAVTAVTVLISATLIGTVLAGVITDADKRTVGAWS